MGLAWVRSYSTGTQVPGLGLVLEDPNPDPAGFWYPPGTYQLFGSRFGVGFGTHKSIYLLGPT